MNAVENTASPPRKTKPKGRHPDKALSAAFVRTAPPGRYCDGNGLYLFVQPSGARSWIQRLVIRGRRRDCGLGSVALVSLAEAREKARANRKLAREGGDPLAEKRRAQGVPSFTEAAARVVQQKQAGWRNPKHCRDWMSSLRRFAFARIGEIPVSQVTSADVLEILAPIWHTKATTARKLRQRIRTVLEWAVAMEFRTDNPCDRLGPVLGAQDAVVQHMRALPHREVASAFETVRASEGMPVVKLVFEFLVLTAARWGEVRGAEWAEIDRREGVWTVPATRMKAKREHRVPLCRRAVEILDEARTLDDGSPLVFTDGAGRQLNGKRLRRAAPKARDRGRAARLPVQLSGLGGRGNGPSARGDRGGAGARGPEQGRGRVSAHGPVRAPPSADERLGRVSGPRASRPGGRSQPLRRDPLRPDPRPIHGWLMTP